MQLKGYFQVRNTCPVFANSDQSRNVGFTFMTHTMKQEVSHKKSFFVNSICRKDTNLEIATECLDPSFLTFWLFMLFYFHGPILELVFVYHEHPWPWRAGQIDKWSCKSICTVASQDASPTDKFKWDFASTNQKARFSSFVSSIKGLVLMEQ